MSGYPLSPATREFRLGRAFALESGAVLPELVLAYRTLGRLNAQADNAVVVCHALTGNPDFDTWWDALVGPGRALDPARDYIVCANALGGCYGSSGPVAAAPDGRRWGARFPEVSVRDQVRAQALLADALGIRGIRLVIGGSMGGLQAIEWPLLDARVQAVATIAASARHSPWCVAWSETQRRIIATDPRWNGGDYDPADPPAAGLAAARAVAMVTYRSAQSFETRFGRASGAEVFGGRARAPEAPAVANWIAHHGEQLVRRFDALSYVRLTQAMDGHDVGRDRGGTAAALGAIAQPVLVVSIPSDALYVPADQYALVESLPDATFARLASEHGHDGFLIDAPRLEPIVRQFRERIERGGRRIAVPLRQSEPNPATDTFAPDPSPPLRAAAH